jgi:hypothetical protein
VVVDEDACIGELLVVEVAEVVFSTGILGLNGLVVARVLEVLVLVLVLEPTTGRLSEEFAGRSGGLLGLLDILANTKKPKVNCQFYARALLLN